MAVADEIPVDVKANPWVATTVFSALGYALVFGTFAGLVPFPTLGRDAVVLLGDAIAVVNFAALTAILAGVRFVRRGEIRKHRASMLTAFALILLFLALYLLKVGGGEEKAIQASGLVWVAYIVMLAIHVVLSAVSVPVVVHAVVLGLTRTPEELREPSHLRVGGFEIETSHARVGRVAVLAWSLSLFLGLVTYVLLNHVYSWEFRGAALFLLAVPRASGLWRARLREVFPNR